MSDESTAETPKMVKIPQPHGGALNAGGTPGNKGGRPTNEYRAHLRAILDSPKIEEALIKILENPDHNQFSSLYGRVVAQAHGNPTQLIEVDSGELPAFKVERE
jgi:hypothetical protein